MKKRITISNTFFSLILQIVTIISGFIIPRLLLKTFGSEVNGLVSSLNQFLNYITLIEGGITAVILANLYKPLAEKNMEKINGIVAVTNQFFKKIAFIFLGYTLILSILYPIIIKSSFSFEYISTLTLILSINLFVQYYLSLTWKVLLQADKKIAFISIVQIICLILNTLSVAIMIKKVPNIHLVKLVTSFIFLIQPLSYHLYIKKHYDINKNVEPNKNALSQRWSGFGINIAAFIHNNTDIIIISLILSLTDVSVYSVYFLVVEGLKRLITSISYGIVPTLGHAYASGNVKKTNAVFDAYEIIIFFATYILFTAGFILITPFVQVYSLGVTDANYYQPILGYFLILAEMTFCLREPYVNMAYSANKFKEVSKFAYIEAILNITISILLVYKYKIIGVAIGTFISMAYRTIMHIIYLKANVLYRPLSKSFIKIGLFTLLQIFIIIICNKTLVFDDISLIGWVIYAIKVTTIVIFSYLILSLIFKKNIKKVLKLLK